MITMTEIARLTNVSQPTVSRVLNGNQNVAPEIRERVLACAREHDYQLNALAKGLQGSRTQLLGVLVTDISNGFFADLTKQIEIEARKNGCSIILFSSGYDPAREREYLDVVRRYRVDGVLAVPIRETSTEWQAYVGKLDVPVVAVTRRAENLDSVYADHPRAGAMVAEHLIQRGFERFLFIGKEDDGKYVGFHQTMVAGGLAGRTGNLVYQGYMQLKAALRDWLRGSGGGRAAVFAGNDIYALQVLAALREFGFSVPEDVGVIGFDDTSMGRYLNPRLSSVSQPIERMAREAVSRLMHRMEAPDEQAVWDMPLEASLVIREST
ncbi:MAG: LacI family transcriptional regulator [Oscillospiraceae bacterium]|nr:LacI family transcriptional regulator [Oscillospiraceae bacterium]